MDDAQIAALTSAEAGAELARMTAVTNPPPPIAPSTAADARRRLDALTTDAAWGKRFLAGNMAARSEFADLSARVASGDHIVDALAGTAPPQQEFETTVDGALPRRVVAEVVADMRENGISDGAIEQALRGTKVTRVEFEATRQLQRIKHSDPIWTKNLLSGGVQEKREHMLMSIILSADIAE